MKMNQTFNDQVAGGVAGNNLYQAAVTTNNIHALVCSGPEACPYDRSEEKLQRQFEEDTGIACGKGPRIAIKHLLDVGHFDRRQVALAWRTKSLAWDWDLARIKANPSLMESIYGYGLMLLGVGMSSVYLVSLMVGRLSLPGMEILQTAATAFMLFMMALLSEKYLVRPNRIATMARPVIEAYYDGHE